MCMKRMTSRISAAAKTHMLATTPVGLVSHYFNEILNDPKFNIFYDAPVLVVICSTALRGAPVSRPSLTPRVTLPP